MTLHKFIRIHTINPKRPCKLGIQRINRHDLIFWFNLFKLKKLEKKSKTDIIINKFYSGYCMSRQKLHSNIIAIKLFVTFILLHKGIRDKQQIEMIIRILKYQPRAFILLNGRDSWREHAKNYLMRMHNFHMNLKLSVAI